jgi:hypothetical protein
VVVVLSATAAYAEPLPVLKPIGPGGSCPHGYTSSGAFCTPSQGAQDAIAKPPNGTCPFGWTAARCRGNREQEGELFGYSVLQYVLPVIGSRWGALCANSSTSNTACSQLLGRPLKFCSQGMSHLGKDPMQTIPTEPIGEHSHGASAMRFADAENVGDIRDICYRYFYVSRLDH